MIFIGLSAQIRKNKAEGRCGQPFELVLLGFAVFLSRALYALSIGAWFILISDVAGTVLSGIILRQYFKYKKD
ncbi:MAG: hypothetical protein WC657_05735 [Candidatus Paceibacterota bacterium]